MVSRVLMSVCLQGHSIILGLCNLELRILISRASECDHLLAQRVCWVGDLNGMYLINFRLQENQKHFRAAVDR